MTRFEVDRLLRPILGAMRVAPLPACRRSGSMVRLVRLAIGACLPYTLGISCAGDIALDDEPDIAWLKICAVDSECGAGSTCSCGRCTRACSSDAECGSLAESAVCGAVSRGCAEARLCMPGPVESEGSAVGPAGAESNCSHRAEDYVLAVPALCFGRELPECPPGSEAFFDACGCGCSSGSDDPRGCRNPCGPADVCEGLEFEDLPDHSTTIAMFVADQQNEFPRRTILIEGHCSNGQLFLYTPGGYTSEARFFTPDGVFLGLTTFSDAGGPCSGETYWPLPPSCEEATATRVQGSDRVQAGDPVRLPGGRLGG